jgi:hypothetical protein
MDKDSLGAFDENDTKMINNNLNLIIAEKTRLIEKTINKKKLFNSKYSVAKKKLTTRKFVLNQLNKETMCHLKELVQFFTEKQIVLESNLNELKNCLLESIN